MAAKNENLVVRQHERLNCALRAELRVAPEHAEKIIFSTAAAESGGVVPVTLIDLSSGGVGLKSKVFLPKQAWMTVRVWAPGADADDHSSQFAVRIQRVQMLDRTPLYYLGAAFCSDDATHVASVNALMKAVRTGAVNAPAAGGAA